MARAYDRVVRTDSGQGNRDRAALRSTLHAKGMRMTPQRQLVLDAVRQLEHATPEQVCCRVQDTAPTVNITTIYRALELLEGLGLVRHTHLGHGAPVYSASAHEHVHLVCHRCGRTIEVDTDLLEPVVRRAWDEHGFQLDPTHLALSGTCRDCQSEEDL